MRSIMLGIGLSLALSIASFGFELAEAGTTWARTFRAQDGDYFCCVDSTQDGGYVMAGLTAWDGDGGRSWWMKLDGSGRSLWERSYGVWGGGRCLAVKHTRDGGYVLAGECPCWAGWLMKTDALGNPVWEKRYSSSNPDGSHRFWDLDLTADGGYLVAGESEFVPWLLRLDAGGNAVWQKRFEAGPNDFAYLRTIRATRDGGCIAVGGTTYPGRYSYDGWVVKLDSGGTVTWQKAYGGASGDNFTAVDETQDGGYVVAGSTESFGAENGGAWIMRLDAVGNVIWQYMYDGPYADGANSIVQAGDDGYVWAGATSSFGGHGLWYDAWLVKVRQSGEIDWQKVYYGNEMEGLDALVRATDGGYVAVGSSASFTTDMWDDALALRVTASGTIASSCGSFVRDSTARSERTKVSPDVTAVPEIVPSMTVETVGPSAIDCAHENLLLCAQGYDRPTVAYVRAKRHLPGSSATIFGVGFATPASENSAYFGRRRATVRSSADMSVKVTIPEVHGTVQVYVVANGKKSNKVPFEVK